MIFRKGFGFPPLLNKKSKRGYNHKDHKGQLQGVRTPVVVVFIASKKEKTPYLLELMMVNS